jgi:hypothetical protein
MVRYGSPAPLSAAASSGVSLGSTAAKQHILAIFVRFQADEESVAPSKKMHLPAYHWGRETEHR